MKQIYSLSIFIFFVSAVFAQVKMPEIKTAKHKLIEGTNIYMVPPDGYTVSSQFKGFQKKGEDASMIMLMELKAPFDVATAGFTNDMLQPRGMNLLSKSETSVGGYKAYLMEMQQQGVGITFYKYLLVYGDSSFTQMINAVYPEDSTALKEPFRNSVLSVVIDTTLNTDPRSALNYTLNETGSGLRFHSVIGNGMLFNRDGKTPTQSVDEVSVISDRSFQKTIILDRKSFLLGRLQKLPNDYSVITNKGIKEITIDGLNGYELYAQNLQKTNEIMYMAVLFPNDGGYYIFIGNYNKNYPQAEKDIKSLVNSFDEK